MFHIADSNDIPKIPSNISSMAQVRSHFADNSFRIEFIVLLIFCRIFYCVVYVVILENELTFNSSLNIDG
jgi:hypothetical protein